MRIYKAKIQGVIDNNILNKIKKGITINKIPYNVISIKIISTSKSYSWLLIQLNEGKNKHIRKIFLKFGLSVNKLIRIQYGPYKISSLKTGNIKFVSPFKLNLKNL